MTKIKTRKDLELGLYQDAAREGMSLSQYLERLARTNQIDEALYRPDARNSQGQPLDAYQQLVAAAGIRTKGEFAQTGDAFLSDPNNRVLFPEFVNRQYRDAERDALNTLQISDLVSTRVGIDGTAYRTGIIEGGQEKDLEFGRVSELGELPVYTIKLSDKAVNAYKYGGILQMSYEHVRRARLPIVSRYIAKIARAQGRRKVKQAISVALNGDGNANPAVASAASAGAAHTLVDLVSFQMDALKAGVQLTTITGDSAELLKLFTLDVFVGAGSTANGAALRDSGAWPSILGMTPKLAVADSDLEGSGKILGIDTQNGLEEFYENGSELTESDRLITMQFERIAFSEVLGYAKPDTQAFRTKQHA